MSVSVVGLDEIITSSKDAREVKRALCVKMSLSSIAVVEICELLKVSAPFVSKWRGLYEAQGAGGLEIGYEGRESYLSEAQRADVIVWVQAQESLEVARVRDYVEQQHGVVYQSRQSYYDLMHEAGLSYHKSEKTNPKRDQELVDERRAAIKKNWHSTRKR